LDPGSLLEPGGERVVVPVAGDGRVLLHDDLERRRSVAERLAVVGAGPHVRVGVEVAGGRLGQLDRPAQVDVGSLRAAGVTVASGGRGEGGRGDAAAGEPEQGTAAERRLQELCGHGDVLLDVGDRMGQWGWRGDRGSGQNRLWLAVRRANQFASTMRIRAITDLNIPIAVAYENCGIVEFRPTW